MDKLERLLNLTAALLSTSRPLSAAELRERLGKSAYSDNKAAFRRTFERDKADLRAIGVPLEVSTLHGSDPPVEGYRIPAAQYSGRDLRFDPDELAALHLATSLVRVEGGAGGALTKLGDASETVGVPEAETVGELPFHEALSTLVGSAVGRRAVSLSYRGAERLVEPWRLSFNRGHWYLVGWDRARSEERLYRVDRIDGAVEASGPAEQPVGQGTDPGAVKPWQFGAGDAVQVRVLVDADQAVWACHSAGVDGERQSDGSVVLTLAVRDLPALQTFVLGFLEHAEVLEPQWVRDAIIDWLEPLG